MVDSMGDTKSRYIWMRPSKKHHIQAKQGHRDLQMFYATNDDTALLRNYNEFLVSAKEFEYNGWPTYWESGYPRGLRSSKKPQSSHGHQQTVSITHAQQPLRWGKAWHGKSSSPSFLRLLSTAYEPVILTPLVSDTALNPTMDSGSGESTAVCLPHQHYEVRLVEGGGS